jgi:hypothetical protein
MIKAVEGFRPGSEPRGGDHSIVAREHEGGCVSAMRGLGASHRSGDPQWRRRDNRDDLPHESWRGVEDRVCADTSAALRAGREQERRL